MGLLGGCGTGARGSTIPVILRVVRVRCGFLALCLLNGGMVLHLAAAHPAEPARYRYPVRRV